MADLLGNDAMEEDVKVGEDEVVKAGAEGDAVNVSDYARIDEEVIVGETGDEDLFPEVGKEGKEKSSKHVSESDNEEVYGPTQK